MDWIGIGAGLGAAGVFLLLLGILRARMELRW
jgi:hypothetical protein